MTMFTLALPILVGENAFWGSDHGYHLIGAFLSDMRRVSDIRRCIVITSDEYVGQMAKQEGMDVLAFEAVEYGDFPLTVEQMFSLAGYVGQVCGHCGDGCIVVDHRNIFLASATLEEAKVVSMKNPETLVFSVTQSRDHPCQWVSFSRFLGAGTIRFDSLGESSESTMTTAEGIQVSVVLREGKLQCRVPADSFFGHETVVVRIVPFSRRADFTRSREILFTLKDCSHTVEVTPEKDSGLLFILVSPSSEGAFDAIEYFTPRGAPWELMAFSAKIRNSNTLQPIFGRQDFPPVYGFDGSFCVKGGAFLEPVTAQKTIPFIVEDVCIVCDWMDYWHVGSTSSQRGDGACRQ